MRKLSIAKVIEKSGIAGKNVNVGFDTLVTLSAILMAKHDGRTTRSNDFTTIATGLPVDGKEIYGAYDNKINAMYHNIVNNVVDVNYGNNAVQIIADICTDILGGVAVVNPNGVGAVHTAGSIVKSSRIGGYAFTTKTGFRREVENVIFSTLVNSVFTCDTRENVFKARKALEKIEKLEQKLLRISNKLSAPKADLGAEQYSDLCFSRSELEMAIKNVDKDELSKNYNEAVEVWSASKNSFESFQALEFSFEGLGAAQVAYGIKMFVASKIDAKINK